MASSAVWKNAIRLLRSASGLVLYLFLAWGSLDGALLRDVPVSVVQPSGEKLDLFASGDEFYNWLHDDAGYTIIQEPETGYYVYARGENGRLVSSGLVVTSDRSANRMNAAALGLPKYLKDSMAFRKDPREQYPEGSAANPELIRQAPTSGTLNNIVIFIRFSGESEYTDAISIYDNMLNNISAGYNSMRNYYYEASYSALTISTTFYPSPSTTVVSYQDSYTRPYYQPYHASTNPGGYQNDTQRRDREHTLLKNAVNGVSSQIPAGLNVDLDSDGYVDNVCFVVYGGPGAWADLLWPHMWSLYSQTAYINSKRVWTYNFQLQTSLKSSGVGVLCHEMFHSLGAPDLYHYSFDGLHPVSQWGLMEYDSNPPRHMLSYMKYRYGYWISSIPEITGPGTYSLSPLSSSTSNCYKIQSPYNANEYFVLEYRKKTTTFENSLPGEGLLVIRINNKMSGIGNADGPPDEVYIYRPNGTLTADGSPSAANFNSSVGRTSITDSTNPSSFLSDGTYGGLSITGIGAVGSTISFNVGSPAVGTSLLRVSASGTGTLMGISPNDSYGNGGGYTDFSRVYAGGQVVNVTAPATWNTLNFYRWYLDGVEHSGNLATAVTMNTDHTLLAVYGIGLGEAVDNVSLSWQTEGKGWYGQSTTYYSGNDAARSAAIAHNEETVLKTTVLGPGNLSFYWRVSSESGYDYLRFSIDGAVQNSISGETSWAQRTYSIGSGVHTLRWKYGKDYGYTSGSDAAWLDLVTYTSSRTWQVLSGVNVETMVRVNSDGDSSHELAADFGPVGLWLYNGGAWTCLTGVNPENIAAGNLDGSGGQEIIGDFGSLGMWAWNAGVWSQISGVNAEGLIAANVDFNPTEEIIGDFGPLGIWVWNGGVWTQISTNNPDSLIAANTDGLAGQEILADLGPSGLWEWKSSAWTMLTANNVENLIKADYNGDARDEIYADLGAAGLYQCDGGVWTQISGSDAEDLIPANTDGMAGDEVVADFGGMGIYQWKSGSWTMITAVNPVKLAAVKTDGDNRDNIVASFAGSGIFKWREDAWTVLTGTAAENLGAADLNGDLFEEVIGDFGPTGLWIW